MEYEEFINGIINDRGRFNIPKGQYKERHHIVPKCLGGSNDEGNLIDLYAREHYIAHKLLALEHPNHYGLTNAWWRMVNGGNNQYHDTPICTPEEHEEVRERWAKIFSKRMSGKNSPCWGKPHPNLSARKPVICIDTMEVFESITAAGKQTNIDFRNISSVCNANKDPNRFALTHNKLFYFYDENVDYTFAQTYLADMRRKQAVQKQLKIQKLQKRKKNIRFVWLNTGEVYDSFHEFERITGLSATAVCACCRSNNSRHCVLDYKGKPQCFIYYDKFLEFDSLEDAYLSEMKQVKCKRQVHHITTNQIYSTIKEASICTGKSESYIGKRCRANNSDEWEFWYK